MNVPRTRYVELYRLAKSYPKPKGGEFQVVVDFNLLMEEGEVVSLVGHSGCGKSTVLGMVAGLIDVTEGGIVVAEREINGPGPDRAMVFQAPCLLPWLTARQNVQLGVDRRYPKATRAERRQICEHYLDLVGLGDSFSKYPRELSGGMQQRVGIARAIALRPKMLLLDEPFGRLDSLTRMELQDSILRILDHQRITTLLVTHDFDEALYMSDRVVLMTNGPRATVGEIVTIPYGRPRDRAGVLEHAEYYELRARLTDFLEHGGHGPQQTPEPAAEESAEEKPIAAL